jgi:prepilin-type N-terminal cleavage/methylation domain-containing protein
MKLETENRKPGNRLSLVIGNRDSMAFTLIEMLVVLGMLGILMGVAFSGIGQARSQARIAKANSEVRELMNAWLSYEAAWDDWPVNVNGESIEADAGNLKELLGDNQEKVVYLHAQLSGGAFRDPWGTPYRFRVLEQQGTGDETRESFGASITFPNRNRYGGR